MYSWIMLFVVLYLSSGSPEPVLEGLPLESPNVLNNANNSNINNSDSNNNNNNSNDNNVRHNNKHTNSNNSKHTNIHIVIIILVIMMIIIIMMISSGSPEPVLEGSVHLHVVGQRLALACKDCYIYA